MLDHLTFPLCGEPAGLNHADLLARGHAARHAPDQQAALAWFDIAGLADPRDVRAQLQIAAELRECGRFDDARHAGCSAVWADEAI
jgi:hypothetical protein